MVYGIYQNPNESITCLVNQTRETFIIQIIGRVRFKYYKEAFEVTLEAQEMHPYTQIIVNFRDVKLSPDNLRFWFVSKFVKNFYKTEKELKIAIVHGERLWDKRFIRFWLKLRAIFGSKVEYQFFEEIKQAENWMYGIEEKEEEFMFFKPDNIDAPQEEFDGKNFGFEENNSEQTFYKIEENNREDEVEDLFTQLDKGEIQYQELEEDEKKEKKSFFGFLRKDKKEDSKKKDKGNSKKKEKKPIKVQLPKVRIKIRKSEERDDKD